LYEKVWNTSQRLPSALPPSEQRQQKSVAAVKRAQQFLQGLELDMKKRPKKTTDELIAEHQSKIESASKAVEPSLPATAPAAQTKAIAASNDERMIRILIPPQVELHPTSSSIPHRLRQQVMDKIYEHDLRLLQGDKRSAAVSATKRERSIFERSTSKTTYMNLSAQELSALQKQQ